MAGAQAVGLGSGRQAATWAPLPFLGDICLDWGSYHPEWAAAARCQELARSRPRSGGAVGKACSVLFQAVKCDSPVPTSDGSAECRGHGLGLQLMASEAPWATKQKVRGSPS